jgi:hypothetical protein
MVGGRAASRLVVVVVVGGRVVGFAGRWPGGIKAAGGWAMLRQLAGGRCRARLAAHRSTDLGVGEVPSRSRVSWVSRWNRSTSG